MSESRTSRRIALTRVLRTLQRAQAHYDRLPVPDQTKVDQARREAAGALVSAFVENLDTYDLRAAQSARNFTTLLLECAQARYSVVEADAYASLKAMDASMVAAVEAASAARFSADPAMEREEEVKLKEFYSSLTAHTLEFIKYHGAELILMIAKEDLARVQGKINQTKEGKKE